ncbi:GH3 auxin-responsive promoter family protein [Saccharothrix sp. 6-C]|uniref:GH3 family domain-containing protein n=1 Tax=Saccharothrix sp. 6-C TaxID=2781735 RepID=UPI0019173205|nr:GH3 auxin-responsive promoter family protein [Saccharothrix sp. 6-C]QQQ79543.1 GH3 auxin-responsive promoter family protein [Saccharothrix sp. 6-C]
MPPESWADAGWPDRYRDRVFAERAGLLDALPDVDTHQREVLDHLLAANADTHFGRAHGFHRIRSFDEYRRAVPIRTYAGLEPWIDRAAAGERRVLTADDPAVFFTSSGSTGAHKKIPVTPTFMRTVFFPFFYAAWAPLVEHFPDVLARPDAVLNLKHDPVSAPPTTASGKPHVGASQVDFGTAFGEPLSAEPGTAAPWARLPVAVGDGEHLEKAYLRLRFAVEHDVRCVIGINPAMVAALPRQLALWLPRLVRDVHDGAHGAAPNRRRATELTRLADRFGTVRPAHLWPNLKVLFCWTSGLAGLYLPRLREEYGVGVTALAAPVAASEGPVAVPLDRHPTAGPLVVNAARYEFADADSALGADTPTLDHHDLEPGREYHVVLSHVGGLYRYAVGDVVRVVDRVRGVPRVAYAGRSGTSDAVGEGLRESHVVSALGTALGTAGLEVRNATCRVAPDEVPHYEFAVEPLTPWSEAETRRFAADLDASLARAATGYRTARRTGRLGGARVVRLAPHAFTTDWLATVASGVRPSQAKDRVFRRDEESWRRLVDPDGGQP